MTINEMILSFKIKLDKIDSEAYPDITPAQCVWFLNEMGVVRFVKQRYGLNNRTRESFEETQKRADDLRTVVQYESIPSTGNGFYPNTKYYPVPNDYWFSLTEMIDVTEAEGCNTNAQRVGVTAIQHNQIATVLEDPFNKPEGIEVKRVMYQNNFQIFHGTGVTLGNLFLGYIKEAIKMALTPSPVDCILPPHTHQEIVDLAVQGALESVESQRYRTFLNEVDKQE